MRKTESMMEVSVQRNKELDRLTKTRHIILIVSAPFFVILVGISLLQKNYLLAFWQAMFVLQNLFINKLMDADINTYYMIKGMCAGIDSLINKTATIKTSFHKQPN